jgi:hypothetical protein
MEHTTAVWGVFNGVWGATEQGMQLRGNLLSLSCLDQELYFLGMTHP